MTQIEALQALEALTLKGVDGRIHKNNEAFKTAVAAITNPGIPQVCGKKTGSDRFASSTSWQIRTIMLLNRIGFSNMNNNKSWYEASNVAPRDGAHGDRITVYFE